jgi:3-isopropylmalate dehydrogenase
MSETIALIPGDGDPRVMEAATSVLRVVGDGSFEFLEAGLTADSLEDNGGLLPEDVEDAAEVSDAILLGYAGGSWWSPKDGPPPETPERALQKAIRAHAVIQPVVGSESMADSSPFKPDRVDINAVDLVIVHAIGGPYYGDKGKDGGSTYDKSEYSEGQIMEVGRTAFDLARDRAEETGRQPQVTSVDKANVLEVSRVWRETISRLQRDEYPDVALEHMLADNAAMQVAGHPDELDVVVADQMFGDILAGEASGLTTPKLIPSAWVNTEGRGIFTPARVEGKGNIAAILLSDALALRHGLGRPGDASDVESAVMTAMKDGCRPPDLGGDSSVREFTDEVIGRLLPARP